MKKPFKYILLFFSVFLFNFFFIDKTSALETVINFDENDHFNFFYEQNHNTGFYRYLVNNPANELISDLRSIGNVSSSCDKMYIFYFREPRIHDHLYGYIQNETIRDNAYYVIFITSSYLSYSYANNFTVSLSSASGGFFFYDNTGEYLGFYKGSNSSSYQLFQTDKYNFQYVLSTYWYSAGYNPPYNFVYFNNFPSKINVGKFVIDNKQYSFSDYSASWFGGNWWYSLTHKNKEDADNYGLLYFRLNYVHNTKKNIYLTYLQYMVVYSSDTNYSVPENYESVVFSFDEPRYIIPNSNTCSSADSYLYLTTSNANSIDIINYALLENDHVSTEFNTYYFKIEKANIVYALDLRDAITTDTYITDNIYLFSASDNIADNNLYYNPACFSSYVAGSDNITFVNVNTGNDVNLSKTEQNKQIDSSHNYSEEVVGNNLASDLNLVSMISTAWNGCTNFINAGYEIVRMSTNLFTLLPDEVSSIIITVFIISAMILLIKLITILKN